MLKPLVSGIFNDIISLSMISESLKKGKLADLGELAILSSMAFFIPFLFSNQLLVGTAVNASLIGGALYLKGKNLLPIIILPSIGMVARGIIFGPISFYLVYMLPFIWIGNALLVLSMKLIHLKMRKPFMFAAVAGSVVKFSLLFSSALALYISGIVPVEFLVLMGALQLVTALAGTMAFYPVNKIRKGK